MRSLVFYIDELELDVGSKHACRITLDSDDWYEQ